MNFLQFKKRFIELYNQQKFLHIDKAVIDYILKAKIEEIEAPTLIEALVLAAEGQIDLPFIVRADLQSGLNAILELDEMQTAFITNKPTVALSHASDLDPEKINFKLSIPATTFNSSALTEVFEANEAIAKPNWVIGSLNRSPIKVLANPSDINLNFKIRVSDSADLTFFTNWLPLEATNNLGKFADTTPIMYSSLYYTLGELGISAKLYDTATMRSITEYFISHYTNPDTYLTDVVDKTVHEFVYHEL